jgi:transposase-like protein
VNLFSLAAKFPTEDAALLHLIRVRWPHGVRCVHCDRDECWLIESTGKTGKPRRLFQCALCRQQFSATSGTVFHDSHLPLTKWFAAIALMAEARKGMSAKQLHHAAVDVRDGVAESRGARTAYVLEANGPKRWKVLVR